MDSGQFLVFAWRTAWKSSACHHHELRAVPNSTPETVSRCPDFLCLAYQEHTMRILVDGFNLGVGNVDSEEPSSVKCWLYRPPRKRGSAAGRARCHRGPANQSCPVIRLFGICGSQTLASRPLPSDTRQLHRKWRRSRWIPPRPPAVRESSS